MWQWGTQKLRIVTSLFNKLDLEEETSCPRKSLQKIPETLQQGNIFYLQFL